MRKTLTGLCTTLFVLSVSFGSVTADQTRRAAPKPQPQKTEKEAAIDFCRDHALMRLKYQKTVEWSDLAKDEGGGVYLVSGIREARSPGGEQYSQQYTCRVQRWGTGWRLRLIQLFRESTKSGRDVFETYPAPK